MATLIGADVVITVDDTVVAGQRNAKLSGSTDMIDMTCKTDFPDKVMRPGWNGELTIECDCLLATGTGGYKYWFDLAHDRTLVDIEICLGDGDDTIVGEQGLGAGSELGACSAYVNTPDLDAPQMAEGTMNLKFTVVGGITWTSA